jgi:hypothetical protein
VRQGNRRKREEEEKRWKRELTSMMIWRISPLTIPSFSSKGSSCIGREESYNLATLLLGSSRRKREGDLIEEKKE